MTPTCCTFRRRNLPVSTPGVFPTPWRPLILPPMGAGGSRTRWLHRGSASDWQLRSTRTSRSPRKHRPLPSRATPGRPIPKQNRCLAGPRDPGSGRVSGAGSEPAHPGPPAPHSALHSWSSSLWAAGPWSCSVPAAWPQGRPCRERVRPGRRAGRALGERLGGTHAGSGPSCQHVSLSHPHPRGPSRAHVQGPPGAGLTGPTPRGTASDARLPGMASSTSTCWATALGGPDGIAAELSTGNAGAEVRVPADGAGGTHCLFLRKIQ